MQLAGLHMVALDAKGRLAIPARYRELIDQRCQGKMVLTMQHHGQSLMLYPETDFGSGDSKRKFNISKITIH